MDGFFYDTSALLNLQERAFERPFAISCVTLYELESIKTSAHKDEETKARARNVTRLIAQRPECCSVYDVPVEVEDIRGVNENDWLIANTASKQRDSYIFVTDDLSLSNIARTHLGLVVLNSDDLSDDCEPYTGVQIVEDNDEALEGFHNDLTINTMSCFVNEYVFLKGTGKTHLGYRWTGDEYELIYSKPIKSREFGDVRPKDIYQRAAVDSIMNNMITGISGPAGSGKSLLSLACSFDLIRRGLYNRVVLLVNPAKAKGAVNLGYYPGTVEEKLMASFIGNMLRSKFGGDDGIGRLLMEDKLRVISMSDIRGMEITEDEILYIPECQNTTVELLKLCLSRVCSGAKVIFEGDYQTQVDMTMFAGVKNGMRRAVQVLVGTPLFGYVELQQIWRSDLAAYIDQM